MAASPCAPPAAAAEKAPAPDAARALKRRVIVDEDEAEFGSALVAVPVPAADGEAEVAAAAPADVADGVPAAAEECGAAAPPPAEDEKKAEEEQVEEEEGAAAAPPGVPEEEEAAPVKGEKEKDSGPVFGLGKHKVRKSFDPITASVWKAGER